MRWNKDDLQCHKYKNNRNKYKDISKEERAKILNNVICPKCKYQNHISFIKKYGTCNLCGTTLDKNYFKKMMLRKLKENV